MKLKKLLKDLPVKVVRGSQEIEVTGIASNSKVIAPGNLFVAKRGLSNDGARFIPEAIASGASCILTDLYDPFLKKDVVQIIHPEIPAIEARLADHFYQSPSKKLYMAGVTGTNGKTTTTFLIRQLLETKDQPCGLIGTIECFVGKNIIPSTHTTPDVIMNHKMLHEMVVNGCTGAVMEVTSHALVQGRVREIDYDVALFTNLTHDHLDYHHTMEEYADAKKRLFDMLGKNKTAIINKDSPWADRMTQDCQARLFTFGIDAEADLRAGDITLSAKGTQFTLHFKGSATPFFTPLIGRFNVYNVLGAIAVGLLKGMPLSHIAEKLRTFGQIPGRLERVQGKKPVHVFVDYSHKEDALRNVLQTLNELKKGKIITVFGCGGARDTLKRPLMGRASEEYSDLSIVTTDNPRVEDPVNICKEICKGFKNRSSYIVELDRRSAIQKAIALAQPGDIVLIAGKGHEAWQIFSHQTIPFDDRLVAKEILNEN